MGDVFIKLLNMSLSASWLILAVIVVRLLLKKAPKWCISLKLLVKVEKNVLFIDIDNSYSGNCILQCPSDTDAFQSGHLAEQNGRPETLRYQLLYHDGANVKQNFTW